MRPSRRRRAASGRARCAIVAEVDDPLPAKTLRWLQMIEQRSRPTSRRSRASCSPIRTGRWPEQLQIIAESTITDPADHELIRRFFAGRAPLTTRGTIRYAEALFRDDRARAATALIRRAWVDGDFSARRGAEVLRQVPPAADPAGPHRPPRQPALGLSPALGEPDARPGAGRLPQAGAPRGCACSAARTASTRRSRRCRRSCRTIPAWRSTACAGGGRSAATTTSSRCCSIRRRSSTIRRAGGSSASCRSAARCAAATSTSPIGWPAATARARARSSPPPSGSRAGWRCASPTGRTPRCATSAA